MVLYDEQSRHQFFFFFFSSRRRHTRLQGDWSSDVCSSDLYVDNQALVAASIGRNFTPALQLAYVVRARYVEVLPGVLRGLPSIGTLFAGLKGIGSEHELQHTAMLIYDTRDSLIIPHSGARYIIYDGFVSRAAGSSVSYSFFGAEARYYRAFGPDVTLAWHAAVRYMPSAGNAPLWALSSLGGDPRGAPEREAPPR